MFLRGGGSVGAGLSGDAADPPLVGHWNRRSFLWRSAPISASERWEMMGMGWGKDMNHFEHVKMWFLSWNLGKQKKWGHNCRRGWKWWLKYTDGSVSHVMAKGLILGIGWDGLWWDGATKKSWGDRVFDPVGPSFCCSASWTDMGLRPANFKMFIQSFHRKCKFCPLPAILSGGMHSVSCSVS